MPKNRFDCKNCEHFGNVKTIEPFLDFLKGSKGEIGPQGPQGIKGDKGDTGSIGPKGEIGLTGPQGIKGDKGDIGSIGPKGDKGDIGPQGIKGDTGSIGPKGDIGPSWKQEVFDEQNKKIKEFDTKITTFMTANGETIKKVEQLEKVVKNMAEPQSPGWGGWGEGITLTRPSHTSIYYPPGKMFIGMHSNRNLYIGNPEDKKYAGWIDTAKGNMTITGSNFTVGNQTLTTEDIANLHSIIKDKNSIQLGGWNMKGTDDGSNLQFSSNIAGLAATMYSKKDGYGNGAYGNGYIATGKMGYCSDPYKYCKSIIEKI